MINTESMSSIHSTGSSNSTVIEPSTTAEDYWTVMVTHIVSPHEVYLNVESDSSVRIIFTVCLSNCIVIINFEKLSGQVRICIEAGKSVHGKSLNLPQVSWYMHQIRVFNFKTV